MHALLEKARLESPGRYFTAEEMALLERDEPYLAPRLRAARAAAEKERAIVPLVVERVFRKYDFESRIGYSDAKCQRDIGYVYKYCVFCMVLDSVETLENKLLWWLRTILHSQNFPGELESIRMTYSLLRQEVARQLPRQDAELLDPYFAAAERILPLEDANAR